MAGDIPTKQRDAVRIRDQLRCFRCGAPALTGQWHHRRSRSVRDEHTHHPCNGIWLCITCHAQVHANPFEARRFGWIVSRHEAAPGDVPAKAFYGTLMLDCTGSFDHVTAVSSD